VFGKILVGTDGSETAKLAVAHAVDLAGALGAELVVATAHGGRLMRRRHRRAAPLPTEGDPESAIAKALLRDAAQAHGGTIQLRTVVVRGPAAQALVELADRERADLIVVGNRGMGRAAWAPLSSVPDRVSHRAPASVLIVDTVGGRRPGYPRILAGTDGSASSLRAVEAALSLASRTGAEVTAAAAAADEDAGRGALAPVRARWPELTAVVAVGPPAAALRNLAESGRYDLLVVGNRGIGGPRRLFGSVPDRVSHQARTSVLIVATA
jgi:nucleotide-binding universal stress UspA family protein